VAHSVGAGKTIIAIALLAGNDLNICVTMHLFKL